MNSRYPTNWDVYNRDERRGKWLIGFLFIGSIVYDHFYPGQQAFVVAAVVLAAIDRAVESLKQYIYCRFDDAKNPM